MPLLFGLVLAIAGAVWFAGQSQRAADTDSAEEMSANNKVADSLIAQQREVTAYLATGRAEYLDEYHASGRDFEQAVALTGELTKSEDSEAGPFAAEVAAGRAWQKLAERTLAAGNGAVPSPATLAPEREAAVQEFLARAETVNQVIAEEGIEGQSKATLIALSSILALGLVILGLGLAARRDDTRRRRARRFVEGLQAARNEREAYGLVKAHLERAVKGSEVSVFNRNNSADRLEPSIPVPTGSPLEGAIEGAAPSDCLAVRTTKSAPGGSRCDDIVRCGICGKLDGGSLCVPSIVGGEVIGSVLVRNKKLLSESDGRQVNEGVSEASPVIAHLRSLAIAERTAASDKLTGLPNKRAAEDTLKNMVAHASRTGTALALILFDLDHFKRINDTYGHPKGDEVLAAVGSTTAQVVRKGDFAARCGGEEFLVLLPGSNGGGARRVAEKLREAIAAVRVPGLEKGMTASFGIASLPTDADGRDELMRKADRALYAAKREGRNRVENFSDANGKLANGKLESEGNGVTPALR